MNQAQGRDDRLYERAKESVDLICFIEKITGHKAHKQGRSYAFGYCPCCGEGSKNSNRVSVRGQLWHCFACGAGGSVIDFGMAYWQKSKLETAKILVGESDQKQLPEGIHKPRVQEDPKEDQERHAAIHEVLKLIFERGLSSEPVCVGYLRDERGLPEPLIQEAFRRGLLRFLPADPHQATKWLRENVGEGLLKRAGLWKEGKRMPGIAFRPIVALVPDLKSAEFRIAREPEENEKKAIHYGPKTMPWWWEGSGEKRKRVTTVEGWIDMLSLVAMDCNYSIMALPGVATWVHKFDEWFLSLRKDRQAEFVIVFDPDTAGRKQAADLSGRLLEAGIPCRIKFPPIDGDLNKVLRILWNPAARKAA